MNYSKIITLYKAKHFTQETLAKQLGMTRANFNLILQRQDMKVSQLELLSEVLEVSPCTFFENTSTHNQKTDNEQINQYKFNALEVESYKKEVSLLREMNVLLRDKIALLQEKIEFLSK